MKLTTVSAVFPSTKLENFTQIFVSKIVSAGFKMRANYSKFCF